MKKGGEGVPLAQMIEAHPGCRQFPMEVRVIIAAETKGFNQNHQYLYPFRPEQCQGTKRNDHSNLGRMLWSDAAAA